MCQVMRNGGIVMAGKLVLIDRQYGSGGREVGKRISKKLGIPFYDGEMLLMAAEKFGFNLGIMQEYDEKNVKSLIYMIAMTAEYNSGNNNASMPQNMYNAMSDTIMRLAKEGQCVIMGRCADYILKGIVDYVSVFVYASDMEQRTKRAIEVDGVSPKDTAAYIKKRDKQRKDYYNFYTDGRWGAAENYDICLNTSAVNYDKCAEIICDLVK